jgi:preprotein translocase subunit SecG
VLFSVLLVVHVLICVALVIVVLMQSAKGEGLAGAFGGGGAGLSGAVFGGRGAASFLSKATTVLAVLFMVSCLGLSFLSSGRTVGSGASSEGSDITQAAQEDIARQQEAARQQAEAQQATEGQEGQTGSPEDLFELNPETPPASDSQ